MRKLRTFLVAPLLAAGLLLSTACNPEYCHVVDPTAWSMYLACDACDLWYLGTTGHWYVRSEYGGWVKVAWSDTKYSTKFDPRCMP